MGSLSNHIPLYLTTYRSLALTAYGSITGGGFQQYAVEPASMTAKVSCMSNVSLVPLTTWSRSRMTSPSTRRRQSH